MKQREIKFRAFDRNSEMKYDVWPVGDTVYQPNGGFWLHNVQAVMQFTGLKDGNGKEIYEGDVIDIPYNNLGRRLVEWEERGRWSIHQLNLSRCAIVGNIYEHPELLKP